MSRNDGGNAFPVIGGSAQCFGPYGEGDSVTAGMSLRDYFAAHASDAEIKEIRNNLRYPISSSTARYIHADDMLKERDK